ncbi:MAG: PaaX family transcriptional regulator C-terminal domain-containing protein [Patescibacteria group bacterium]
MKKLLRPGDVLLLGLAGTLDIFDGVKDPFGVMANGCKSLYGWVPSRYRRHNFSRLLNRQLQTGDIEKVVNHDEVFLRLTSVGRERIVRDFPMLSLANKPWDGRWRIVIFDIAEIDKNTRELLRDKIRQLGLGMLQESVWITPHDVSVDLREFLESKDLGEAAFVLEISSILAGDQELLVRKIWNLDDLEEVYRDIIEEAGKLNDLYVVSSGRNVQYAGAKRTELIEKVRKIRQGYGEALLSDPCLPRELLPKDWPAEKTRRVVRDLQKII